MTLSTDDKRVTVNGRVYSQQQAASGLDYGTLGPALIALDVVVILLASLGAAFVYYGLVDSPFELPLPFGIGISAAVAFVLLTQARGLYRPWRYVRITEQVTAAMANWAFAVLFVGTVIFCFKVGDEVSRGATALFAAVGFVTMPTVRLICAAWLQRALARQSVLGRRAIVIGDDRELAGVAPSDLLQRLGLWEMRRFVLGGEAKDTQIIESAIQFARIQRVEEIVLAMPWSDLARLDAARDRLRALPIPVKLLPDEAVHELLDSPRVEFGPSVAIEVQRAPLSRTELAMKRALDILVSGSAVIVLAPLLLMIAAAVKLDSKGPAIFRQRRNGFGGREFTIYKFRSMTVMEDGAVVTQAKKNDKRVTKTGAFLRSTSLDELPQILNVLFGHMSIVGPRPHALAHDDAYSKLISGYAFRHHVKPGITGWAQVQGFRGETAKLEQMERRVELDLWYIDNWSIWLDVKIILMTFIEVIRKKAY